MPIPTSLRKKVLAGKLKEYPLKEFGLKGRGTVFIEAGHCIKVIDRASRYLQKDANAFITELSSIANTLGKDLCGHVLIRRAPICSKARARLEDEGFTIDAID